MKYVIYGMSMFGILIGFFLLFFSIRTKPMKQEELSAVVGQAMKSALETSMKEQHTDNECVELFLNILGSSLEGKGELQSEIYYVSVANGIFRGKVTLEFTYLSGQKGVVETERTLIYDGKSGEIL